jgi:hypothetical protein
LVSLILALIGKYLGQGIGTLDGKAKRGVCSLIIGNNHRTVRKPIAASSQGPEPLVNFYGSIGPLILCQVLVLSSLCIDKAFPGGIFPGTGSDVHSFHMPNVAKHTHMNKAGPLEDPAL